MEIPPQLPFCVYILLSEKDGNFYVGITTDLSRRLDEHNQGRNTSTVSRRPFRLIHAELYSSKEDAVRRETYLKSAKGRRVLKLMLADTLGVASAEQAQSNI
jgi:putative endonuclease